MYPSRTENLDVFRDSRFVSDSHPSGSVRGSKDHQREPESLNGKFLIARVKGSGAAEPRRVQDVGNSTSNLCKTSEPDKSPGA